MLCGQQSRTSSSTPRPAPTSTASSGNRGEASAPTRKPRKTSRTPAKDAGAYLIAVSTDMVFPGDGGAPYAEDAATAPISAYGRSKLMAEHAVLEADSGFAVARTAWLYGGAGKHFPRTVLTVLRDRGGMEVVDDEFGSPTYAGDLAEALVQLASPARRRDLSSGQRRAGQPVYAGA